MRTLTADQLTAPSVWLAQPYSNRDEASRWRKSQDDTPVADRRERRPFVSHRWSPGRFDEQRLRFARCRAADYFRSCGLEDPDVLAAASQHAVRVAVRSLRNAGPSAAIARLPQATIATADAMRRRTIRRLDASLPGTGGASRRGELSTRLATLLAEMPECLLDRRVDGAVISLTSSQNLRGLEMPTEEPVPFPPQSLVATGSDWLRAVCRVSRRWCQVR